MMQAKFAASQAEEGRKAVQGELDDLLMVFGDLEDKVDKYKVSTASELPCPVYRLWHDSRNALLP